LTAKRYYVGIDPGATTGVALWESTANVFQAYDVLWEQRHQFACKIELQSGGDDRFVFIVENFRLFKSKAVQQAGSQFQAVKIIGVLEYLSFKWHHAVIFQEPRIQEYMPIEHVPQRVASMLSSPHQISAAKHLVHWLRKNDSEKFTRLSN
jgi:hypothetical protein